MSSKDQISVGKYIMASAGYDHTIRFWDIKSGVSYRVLNHNESQVNCMAIYPDKSLLATGGFQQVSIYDTMSNNQNAIYSVDGTVKNTVSIGFENKGSWMFTAGEDKTVKLWDMKARHINCKKVFTHTHPISCVALHPNQIDFFIGDENGNLVRWDRRTNQSVPLVEKMGESKSAIRSISLNVDGTMMAVINNDGNCHVWALSGGFGETSPSLRREMNCQAHRRYGLKCLFSPDSTLLATSSADGTAKIWRTFDLSLVKEFKETKIDSLPRTQSRWIWDLAFTSDSEYLITASSDKLVRSWSVVTGELKREFVGHQKPVVCLAFSDS